ncbi:MAG: iron-sulfur cluster insertion protein ErpA [Deltaproteobacteria bacterium]|nr:iron-sulfur cluster insertion protein ErpA [Deltaproteobacteria bacterium]
MITLTEKAVNHVKKMLTEQNTPDSAVRVGVVGGGCAGLSYKFTFEEKATEEDQVVEQNGVKILLDPKSYLFLNGVTIDYHSDLMSSGFTFHNPNAKSSCGCGTSFSV